MINYKMRRRATQSSSLSLKLVLLAILLLLFTTTTITIVSALDNDQFNLFLFDKQQQLVEDETTSTVSCYDTPSWTDAFGDTCSYYSSTSTKCSEEGNIGAGSMGVANDNCCVCGGGSSSSTVPDDGDSTVVEQTTTADDTPTTTTETLATNAAGDIIVNPGGTCGKMGGGGNRGNGICENGECCSKVRCKRRRTFND